MEESDAVLEYTGEMPLEGVLDCVDEIERIICLTVGLKHMCMDVIECAPELKRNTMVRHAYADILYREMDYVTQRLNAVSEVLYSDVQRRGRIRRIIRKRKTHSGDKRQISPA